MCVGAVGAIDLASSLQNSSTITHLDVARNRIAPEGAKALAVALGTCVNLRKLCLFYNGIRDSGAQSIAKELQCVAEISTVEC